MSTIDQYVTKEIFKHFAIVLMAAIGIYLAVDFFENVDKFINAGLPVSRILLFFQLKLPFIISQITPVGILLAVLVTFGIMNKNNEIIALKSGGMSVYHFLRPIIFIGLLVTVGLFFISETVVPITISKANDIWRREVKKYTLTSAQKNIWFKGSHSISHITYFNPKDQTISGITLNYFDEQFRLTRRVDAAKGKFKQGQWVLYDAMEQVLNNKSGSYDVTFQSEMVENLDFLPEDLKRVAKKSEEMSFQELYRYVQDIESEGYDATPYWVDYHSKFALPVVCLILCIIATGITLRTNAGHGLSITIIYGITVVFLYWISQSFCLSLGHGGVLSPIIAAWISNFMFACFAGFNLLNAE
ncbi:MAG: LPS export ABC transporter permease LptG [Desulfobacterales bacterium]|jgi:lipopolysaccharide export system permease protein